MSHSLHRLSSLPLSGSKLLLSLFPAPPRLGKMEPRRPSVDGPISDTASNQHHKDDGGWYGNVPEVGIRVPDALEVLEVHTKVTTEEGQRCEEDSYQGDDGHVCVGASPCRERLVVSVFAEIILEGRLTDGVEHERRQVVS